MVFKLIFWIVVAIATPILIYFIGSKSKLLKIGLQVVLLGAIFVLGFMLYESIMEPIHFEKKKIKRERAAVYELMQIRKAQIAYKKENGKYTPSFDSLINFVMYDSLTEIKRSGEIPDSLFLQNNNVRAKAEKQALEMGLIRRDTVKVGTRDSLFKDYNIEDLGKVPFTESGQKFELDTITKEFGGININLFQAHVYYENLFEGLNKDLIENLKDNAERNDKFLGFKVGSLKENNNNSGNWSKELELKK